jgi:hypothetical protein
MRQQNLSLTHIKVRAEQLGVRDYYLQQAGRLLFVLSMLTLLHISPENA